MRKWKLVLPIFLVSLILTGFSAVYANNGAEVSLEHGGTFDTAGSRIFNVQVCTTFTVEYWVRELPEAMNELYVYVTWDADLMELVDLEIHLPEDFYVDDGPFEEEDSYYVFIKEDDLGFDANHKWITFTFHCKGEGSSPINLPDEYPYPGGGIILTGPEGDGSITHTKLKASVDQYKQGAVGGFLTSTNKLTVLAPYLSLVGLVAAATTAAVIIKRRQKS